MEQRCRPDNQVTKETSGSLWGKGQILRVRLEKGKPCLRLFLTPGDGGCRRKPG